MFSLTNRVRLLIGCLFLVGLLLPLSLFQMGFAQEESAKKDSAKKKLKLSKEQADRLFLHQVKPLLKKKCFGCHGEAEDLEGDLDMLSRKQMLRGGSTGPALIPGNAEKSPIYQSLLPDAEVVMPPKERNRLTKAEIALVKNWIDAGAPWPKVEKTTETVDGWDKYKPEDLWAFQPLTKPLLPLLNGSTHQHPIDTFIESKLQEKDLAPAPRADRRTLIRRATFDLTGLPPTPEEIDAFAGDESPDAWERLIDRLLASPQYGERWGRHWLDVVRYADSSGFSNDYERPNVWRYRDYVVRSFNQDKPYDRFVVEQLAGDELYDTQQEKNPELIVASGFLRMGPWEHTGMSVKAVTRQYYLNDVTHGVGITFLATGLRCCQCHDHKFDPIPTKDYYRMQAFFAPLQFADRKVDFFAAENIKDFAPGKERTERLLKEAVDYLALLKKKHADAVKKFLDEKGVKNAKELPPEERPKRHVGLSHVELGLQKIFSKRRDYFQRELKRYQPLAFSVYSGPDNDFRSNKPMNRMVRGSEGDQAQEVFVLANGAIASPGERVESGFLSAANRPASWGEEGSLSTPQNMHGRRLALARWIADGRNPLTARVLVNRLWHYHFGKGIAQNPSNFGKMGRKPTHPGLLDYLAVELIDGDWSIKNIHRSIMTSAVYQRSSEHSEIEKLRQSDAANDLLAFFPPRRLTAEEIRDSLLAISGELNLEMGGPGVFPEIHWEAALQPRHIMGSVAPAYQPSPNPAERHRRTIYSFRYRTLADPMLEVFNQPNSEISCERRDQTTTPPQVFALFNDQGVHNRALALAVRLQQKHAQPSQQIDAAMRLVLGRLPDEQERKLCLKHIEKMTAHHRKHPAKPRKLPREVTRTMIEELTGEPYTWIEKLDLMEHYQADLSPADVGPATRALADMCLVLLNSNEFVYVY